MAVSDYDKQKLSAQQQAQIQDLTNKWNELDAQYKQAQQSGNTALADSLSQQKTDLHDQAQAIRRGAGYSGGLDGGQNISLVNSGGKTVNEQVYAPVSESIAAATPVKDKNGNTVRTASKEASDATKELYNQQVQKQAEYVNNNPDAVKPFASGEFMEIYGDVYTTAPNGTLVKIKDLVDVGGTASYTYSAEKAAAAKAQGYNVVESEYLGKPAWYIEGVDRTNANGTSGADESLLSDTAYAALLYERQLWYEDDAKYQEALAAGNSALAEQYKTSRDQHHLNAERLRSNTWLGGYGGGTDGSMYIDYTMEAAKGNMPAYTDAAQKLLGSKGMEYTLPSWQQEEQESNKYPTGGSGSLSGGTTPGGGNIGDTTSPAFKVNDYSQYIQDMYAAQKAAALSSINAAYEKNKAAIERAGEGVAETYQNARNQTAGASELAKRNFAQYAAANGLNSGTGGQMELARNVALQNNLNTINTAEGQSMADLELQKANAETAYNDAIVQAEQQGNYELANSLYQEKVRVQETLLNLQIQQMAMQYQAYRDSVSDNQWQAAFEQNVAQQNFDNSLALQQYLTSLRNGATNTGNTMTLSTAKQAAANGAFDAEVIATLKDNGYTDSMLSLIYGYNGGIGSNNNISGTPVTGGTTAYDNGSLTADQVREMQAHYGLSVDGYWGPNSQKTTGMGANEAWAQYQKSKGALTPDNATMSTPGYVELVNELTRIEDSGRNVATKAAIAIQEALEDGKITQALADKLFAQYGL